MWYVLVHNSLRKLCYGSKKWRWLIQWIIWNLRVLSKELTVQTLSHSTRRIASALNRIIQSTRFKKKVSLEMKAHKEDRGQGDGVPKAGGQQAAADSRGARTCVCVNTFCERVAHAGERMDELTSCRGTVQSAWQKPPVWRKGGRTGLPKKGKWPPRGTGTTVLTYPGSAPR